MIYFSNPGHLPILAAITLGVSAKESEDAIGKFGTGLKYTIAGVLRLGGEISINIGGDIHRFSAKPEVIRNQTFHIVHMSTNGGDPVPCGFTTDLGKHWEPWMYVRELWSNMRDEGGECAAHPLYGDTVISVRCPTIEEAFHNLPSIIIPDDVSPIASNYYGEIYPRRPGNAIYYRRIRVAQPDRPMQFTYNLHNLPLTEDRTVNNPWAVSIQFSNMVAHLEDEALIEEIILSSPEGFESTCWGYIGAVGDTFKLVVGELWRSKPWKLPGDLLTWAESEFKAKTAPEVRDRTKMEDMKIKKAERILRAIGLNKPVEILIPANPDQKSYGFALNGKVYLSSRCLDEGVGQIVTTLIEEYLHVHEGLEDYTREIQDRMLNIIVRLAEEHIIKEPI